MITFSPGEIFEMAEQIERNGAKFYRRVADQAAGEPLRRTLLGLAQMEDDHERRFAAMRSELSKAQKGSTAFDPDDQGALYLQALADGHVFDVRVDPSEKLSGDESTEQVLRTAIGLEKDSIVFYIGLKDLVPSAEGKARVDAIIAEEMGHIATLSGQLREAARA